MRYLMLILLVLMVAPLFAPHDPMATDSDAALQPPSLEHLLGTDQLGRDVLSRALFGGQRALAIASLVTGGTILLAIGCASAWRRSAEFPFPYLRIVINTIRIILTSIPTLVTVSVTIVILGNHTTGMIWGLILSQSGHTIWSVIQYKVQTETKLHINATRSLGATETYIFLNHTLPDLLPHLLRTALLIFNATLLTSGAITFLGFGAPPGTPDWGIMLQEGRQAFRAAPWIATAPGIAITLISITMLHAAQQSTKLPPGNQRARRRLTL
jgi:ABC-type dipeptide/oligopeptide/nickel transport system permease subunit